MNLEDYAYNQDDRWYIDPQVSLDEQNAFINNLRSAQAQDNAQIEAQTRGLGTQVPSQLGGLTGAGGYFKARYQTPQTNQSIADLRASAQAQALNSVLRSEVSKAKKAYEDAYRQNKISSESGQSPLYDANADITGDLEYNTNLEGIGEVDGIWGSQPVIGENTATWGLFILRRDEGESQTDWEARARKWAEKKVAEYAPAHVKAKPEGE